MHRVDFVSQPSTSAAGALSAKHQKLAVALYDRERQKIRLVPVAGDAVFRMEPRAAGVDYGKAYEGAEIDPADKKARNRRLVDAFGSVRRKRQLLSKDAGRVVIDAVAGADVLKAQLASKGKEYQEKGLTKEAVEEQVRAARNFPPHHAAATAADEAYRLQDLVPTAAWETLPVARLLKCSEDAAALAAQVEKGALHAYTRARIESLAPMAEASAQSKAARKRRGRALVFLDALLRTHGVRKLKGGSTGASLARELHTTDELGTALLGMFFSGSRTDEGRDVFLRPKEQEELLLMYILVTAMLAEEWTLEPELVDALRGHLKLGAAAFVQRCRELGFHCASQGKKGTDGEYKYKVTFPLSKEKEGQTLASLLPKPKKGGKGK